MKKSILRVGVAAFAVTVAVLLMLVGCEDAASPNNNELVDGFLVRVNQKPETGTGTGTTKYKVTVSSEGTGAYGDGSYEEGATVVIDAGTRPNPYRFEKWTTENQGVNFTNSNSANTAFWMPAHAVTVTAVFWDWGTLNDSRDGKKYKTAKIGGMTWMAENLNYKTSSGSWCYDNDESNCNIYGRLYDWNTAMSVCPQGWHLPTKQEWGSLVTAVGGSGVAGAKLKAASGWYSGGNGTDDYGFTALPGGYRSSNGTFDDVGAGGHWWTATESSGSSAYIWVMNYYDDMYEIFPDKGRGNSVRCVEDVRQFGE